MADGHDRPPFRSRPLAGADVPQQSIRLGGVSVTSRGGAGDLPRGPLERHRSFITSQTVAEMMAAQIRC